MISKENKGVVLFKNTSPFIEVKLEAADPKFSSYVRW